MSESIYPVKPLVFSSSPGSVREEGDEVIVPRALMNEWIDLFPPGQPMLAHLACIETEVRRIVCIGCDNEEPFVFAPHWILEQMGLTPDTPLSSLWSLGRAMRFFDGPDEVHLRSVARAELAKARETLGSTAVYYSER